MKYKLRNGYRKGLFQQFGIEKDETLTLGNMKDENGKLVENNWPLTTKLKALVFIPDLYEDGVEATKYKYANGDFIEAERTQ